MVVLLKDALADFATSAFNLVSAVTTPGDQDARSHCRLHVGCCILNVSINKITQGTWPVSLQAVLGGFLILWCQDKPYP
jgi:hypothetical protein